MRRHARLINTRQAKDFDAVAVCLILPQDKSKPNAVVINLPLAVIDLVEVFGLLST